MNKGRRRGQVDQVPTYRVPVEAIMARSAFQLGVDDLRAGRPFRDGIVGDSTSDQWAYERGRQWAAVAPLGMVLFTRSGAINPAAADLYLKHAEIL